MSECWLKANWRPVATAMLMPSLLFIGAILGAVFSSSPWVRGGCLVLGVLAVAMLGGLATLLAPRLARQGDQLLVRLRFGAPIQVPLEHVEVFFFGQGPVKTGPMGDCEDEDQQDQTSNIVVRLAESATDLHHRVVEDRLGRWFEGYIVIRGTHCEPLDKNTLAKLNQRLVEYHRQQRAAASQ